MPVRVVIIRHGERIDEVNRQEWYRIRTDETKHDPPLTTAGWDQAKLAGGKVAALLQKTEGPVTIYSSPTARTLSTAAGIVGSLRGQATSVTPVYALNCCAAAQHHGVAKGFPKGEPQDDVMRGVPITCWPPLGDPEQVDKKQRRGSSSFSEVVRELAANHSDGDLIILVTHREGIWDVLQKVGAKMKSGYCNISLLSFDPSQRALQIWDPDSEPRPSQPAARQSRSSASPGRLASMLRRRSSSRTQSSDATVEAPNETDTLESVLARGSGTVVVHRGGRSGGTGTLLWRTPGVRGNWVEGGAVADGEVVTLLSAPVTSEGNEGDFVLIRRSSGLEGWTKVKNVHLRAGNM